MQKTWLVMRLVRWPNLLIIFVTQYFTAIFLAEAGIPFRHVVTDPYFFLLCLSTVLIAAGGYIINDYYDIKIDDYINSPPAQGVLDGCYVIGDPTICSQVIRVNGDLSTPGAGPTSRPEKARVASALSDRIHGMRRAQCRTR